MSRQLAEAILIEEEGRLNKRIERGFNHLYRLQSTKTPWEEENLMTEEMKNRANKISDLSCFVDIVKNVMNKCTILNQQVHMFNTSSCSRLNKRRKALEMIEGDSEVVGQHKRLMENTSTPKWEHRHASGISLDLTPIKRSPIFNLSSSIGSLGSSFSDSGSAPNSPKSTGLSPLVRKLLIKPKNEAEELANLRLLTETINITRAALWYGIIHELVHKLDDNAFYRPYGRELSLAELVQKPTLSQWDYNYSYTQSLKKRKKGVLSVCNYQERERMNDVLATPQYGAVNLSIGTSVNNPEKLESSQSLGGSPELRKRGETC